MKKRISIFSTMDKPYDINYDTGDNICDDVGNTVDVVKVKSLEWLNFSNIDIGQELQKVMDIFPANDIFQEKNIKLQESYGSHLAKTMLKQSKDDTLKIFIFEYINECIQRYNEGNIVISEEIKKIDEVNRKISLILRYGGFRLGPIYRYIGPEEYKKIIEGEQVKSNRWDNNLTDVTNNKNYGKVRNLDGDNYRISFVKAVEDRVRTKSKDQGEFLLEGTYSLNDIAIIEKQRFGDEEWEVVYEN